MASRPNFYGLGLRTYRRVDPGLEGSDLGLGLRTYRLGPGLEGSGLGLGLRTYRLGPGLEGSGLGLMILVSITSVHEAVVLCRCWSL